MEERLRGGKSSVSFALPVRLKRAIAEQQPEDRLAELKADRSAAGTQLVEELDGKGKRGE
jgi:hypothetical protein